MKLPTNIWDLAIQQSKEKRADVLARGDSQSSQERSLLILGSRGVGKTTLIHRFLDSQDSAKPTLALEYTFGRKTNNNLAKDVCHIWELGGGTLFTKLLETPLAPLKLPKTHVVVMIDLSKPEELWFTLETLTGMLQSHLEIALKSQEAMTQQIEEKLNLIVKANIDQEHPDKDLIKPFPLPLIILGGKYDEFQNFDPEKKKIICKALRFFAHVKGATLQFYSASDSSLLRKAKDLLSYHAFETDAVKGVSQDYNKPLFIPAFSDSIQAIMGQSGAESRINLDMWKHQYTTHFPQSINPETALPADPSKDVNFKEDRIDKLRAQKDDELDRYRRATERSAAGAIRSRLDQSR